MFTRSEVIVLTNTHKQTDKQTTLKTSNALCYATTLGNKSSVTCDHNWQMNILIDGVDDVV